MKLPAKLAIASLAIVTAASSASAQNATTDPVGFVTTNITASPNGVSFAVTPISPVLVVASGVSGSTLGSISAVGSNTLSVASAGWADGQLSASDVYVLVKNGTQEGLILQVNSNTADTLTLGTDGLDLSAIGIAVGNTIQLVQGDTLLSMFGNSTTGVVGGTSAQFSAGATDRVTITDSGGAVRTYFFNTDFNQWRRTGSGSDQGSVRISPTSGAFYSRIGQTNYTWTSTGSVPVSQVKYIVPTSGSRFIARYFPTSGNINDFGFQNLPSWRSTNKPGVTTSDADKVITTDSGGAVRTYFYNGTEWRRSGSGSSQNNTAVPIGGAVQVQRFGSGPADIVSVSLPYSL